MLNVLWNWTSGIEPPTTLIFEDFGNVPALQLPPLGKKSSPIVWLHGPAGTGKSAIAQSLCQKLEAEGRLRASFFFKRGHPSRGNAKRLIATIAYQLALRLPDFNHHISQSIESDPSLVDKSLSIQLQKLIVEPCQQSTSARPLVVMIDGLDECEDENSQQEILHSIGHAVTKHQLGLRFLVASRPEPHIREIFTRSLNRIHCPLNVNQSFEDVRKYLLDEFARIHRDHCATMARVQEPWPSQEIINDLVEKSSGYFIYASTIIKFIDDKHFRPTERLAVITGMAEPHFGVPFAALDQLYTQILAQVHAQPQLLKILKVITTDLSDGPLSVTSIEQLLQLEPGDVQLALHGLHSVINLQDHCYISTHHASFCDFLQDPARAGIFYIGGCQHHTDLSRHILKAFSYKYDDPSLNRQGHVAWWFCESAFECATSSEPSSDLITLLRSFNPDFLFDQFVDRDEPISIVLNWLKKSQPLPEDLIQLWEDYQFMAYCEEIWVAAWFEDRQLEVTWSDRDHSHQILLRASPSIIRILQAIRLIPTGLLPALNYLDLAGPVDSRYLFKIHFLLDFSWDELRTAICSLRSFIRNKEEGLLSKLLITALDPTLFPAPFESIMSDLACNSLHFMQWTLKLVAGRVVWDLNRWSYYLRACPPSHMLLEDLEPILEDYQYALREEYHNIAQWLKTFPQPPQELISRTEGYLEEHLSRYYSSHPSAQIVNLSKYAHITNWEGEWRKWYNSTKRYLSRLK